MTFFPPQIVLFPMLFYTLLQLSTPSPLISLVLRNSSLQKQPFITAHFRSSLHILGITAR